MLEHTQLFVFLLCDFLLLDESVNFISDIDVLRKYKICLCLNVKSKKKREKNYETLRKTVTSNFACYQINKNSKIGLTS